MDKWQITGIVVPGISTKTAGSTKVEHSDRLGTNKLHTDVSGNTAGTQDYDAFGVLTSTSGVKNSLGFAGSFGYQEDDETGLKLLGHRLYDPSVGRFVNRDPIGSGLNWFGYCQNNPLKRVDPTGLDDKILGIIRKGIQKGLLPPGTAKRYQTDKEFKERVHRGLKKIPGKKKNPDQSEEDVIDAVESALNYQPATNGALSFETLAEGALIIGLGIACIVVVASCPESLPVMLPVIRGVAQAVGG